ncbi:MAG: hypothetical protein ACOYMF_17010 [Bacteroidales bacterium]|jgi:hypothetical protein
MKTVKNIATAFAVLIAVLMCFDDSFASSTNGNAVQAPLQSDCSDVTHHHHFSVSDHFFQKKAVLNPDPEPVSIFKLYTKYQSGADQYLSSIWQPPQI